VEELRVTSVGVDEENGTTEEDDGAGHP